jgi:photosystem II stability/assembly factor-like uncharacterized protein
MNMQLPSRGQPTSWWHIPTLLIGAAIVMAFALPATAAASGNPGWHAESARAAGTSGELDAVDFVDTTHGWTLGNSTDASFNSTPTLLATTDGGAHWNAESVGDLGSDGTLASIHFIDRNDGWVVGSNTDGAVILVTTDGGLTWNAQDAGYGGVSAMLTSVTFVDAEHGWAVGSSFAGVGNSCLILATSDGGVTWNTQDTGSAHTLDNMAVLDSVTFVNDRLGWAVGDTGGAPDEAPIILATRNGGLTWKAQRATSKRVYGGLYSMSFVDSRHGWAVGGDGGEQVGSPVILHTTNGGKTWKREKAPAVDKDAFLAGVTFANAQRGWAVGNANRGYANSQPIYKPIILVTRNGGGTWVAQNASRAGNRGALNSICVVGTRRGWAVGSATTASGHDRPTIIATKNGGFQR